MSFKRASLGLTAAIAIAAASVVPAQSAEEIYIPMLT